MVKPFSQFLRITSTGKYIPEVDGIRFVAIVSVVCFHAAAYYSEKHEMRFYDLLNHFFQKGYIGVYLFFVLSGYILSAPFAEKFSSGVELNGDLLKHYFLRRITRLEPPYIISLVSLFILLVWVTHNYTAAELMPHFLASLGYLHSIIYHDKSVLNSPLWTLEIEVQFYLLAPFICYLIFHNRLAGNARVIMLSMLIILFSVASWYFRPSFQSLWEVISFFLAGMLVTELLRKPSDIKLIHKVKDIAAVVILVVILYCGYDDCGLVYQIGIKFLIVALYMLILQYKALHLFFSNLFLCIIGGACYSIYLIHYPAISFVGRFIKMSFSSVPVVDELLHMMVYIIFATGAGLVFYKIFERPFMDKLWPHKLKIFFSSKRA